MNKFLMSVLILVSGSVAYAHDKDESSLSVDELRRRCDLGIGRAEEFFQNGQTNDQESFLILSEAALESCRLFAQKAGGWKKVTMFVSTGRSLCKQSSDQRSILHHGTCLLKLGQTVRII